MCPWQRHSAIQKQELKIEHKKQRRDEREQNLRQQEAEAKAAEAERHARFRASGLKAKRNKERCAVSAALFKLNCWVCVRICLAASLLT